MVGIDALELSPFPAQRPSCSLHDLNGGHGQGPGDQRAATRRFRIFVPVQVVVSPIVNPLQLVYRRVKDPFGCIVLAIAAQVYSEKIGPGPHRHVQSVCQRRQPDAPEPDGSGVDKNKVSGDQSSRPVLAIGSTPCRAT